MRNAMLPLCLMLLASCQPPEAPFLAKVGEATLTVHDVLLQMPLTCTGADSALFVQQQVEQWVNEQLLYQQGLKNVPNLDEIEQLVAVYHRDLIARTYEAERLAIYSDDVSEAECLAFYDLNKQKMRLEYPIIQGFYVKVLANSSKVNSIKGWLKDFQKGNMDHAEELEQFCQQRAVDYDSFMDQWVDMRRLTDRLPVKVWDAAQFLRQQVYQQKDQDYIYLFLITDFRLKGQEQPYDFCYGEIHELLVEQKQDKFRLQLQKDLRDEALRTGLLKFNN